MLIEYKNQDWIVLISILAKSILKRKFILPKFKLFSYNIFKMLNLKNDKLYQNNTKCILKLKVNTFMWH